MDDGTVCVDVNVSSTALEAVAMVFSALGRVLICLDRDFQVVHASPQLDRMLGEGAARASIGLRAEQILGRELFGDGSTLRTALVAGESREGWRAVLATKEGCSKRVALTAVPFRPDPPCDQRVAYIVVLRPAEEDPATSAAPTVFCGLIARSSSMLQIFDLVQNLRSSDATILLMGESGTGKELVARAIHANSSRRQGPFVAVNCGGLPSDLLESEMFGHVRGAFTGAIKDRLGRFEMARHGTLFLDEVGDLPLTLQVKLLRVLQEHVFERVGESSSRTSDARIIAATNLDLRRAVIDGRFREDLYYRLRVVPIEIPPLRTRREDIEPLARHLLSRVNGRQGRALRFSPDALRALLTYTWPGNVRELENAIEYAVACCKGQTILPEDLPIEVFEGHEGARARVEAATADPETSRLRTALEAARWRREDAARALGMSRTTLWRKMREHGLL